MISFDKLPLLTFSVLVLILVAESHRKILAEDNEKELERLLNYVNKPAIKSFQVSYSLSKTIFDIMFINLACLCDHNHFVSRLHHIYFFAFRQTEHGDILDCIDINKQLAFDHPMLKIHSVQVFKKFATSIR